MTTLNMKVYEDGQRTILVFDNVTSKTKDMIKNIVSSVTEGKDIISKQVPNVAPVQIEEPKMPNIEELERNNIETSVPDIDAYSIIKNEKFAGFCKVYRYFADNKDKMSVSQYEETRKQINAYIINVWQRWNPEQFSDEVLQQILCTGSAYVFGNYMEKIYPQAGCATLNDFLQSGRNNLINAYNAITAKMLEFAGVE